MAVKSNNFQVSDGAFLSAATGGKVLVEIKYEIILTKLNYHVIVKCWSCLETDFKD